MTRLFNKKIIFFLFIIISIAVFFFCVVGINDLADVLYINTKIHKITSPAYYQVIQRSDTSTVITVEGNVGWRAVKIEYAIAGPYDQHINAGSWKTLTDQIFFTKFSGSISLNVGVADIFLRSVNSNGELRQFDPVRVFAGDVFIVAGQSNAAGESQTLNVSRSGMVYTGRIEPGAVLWKTGNDPQVPGSGGSVWPLVGDSLYELLRVPVGFINIAKGGTSVNDWMPGTINYSNLLLAANTPNRIKAVLWDQGEKDQGMNMSEYYGKLKTIIDQLNADCNYTLKWVICLASYNKGTVLPEIRNAQNKLTELENVVQGPDSDSLGVSYREEDDLHFNGKGNEAAAKMWVRSLSSLY